MPQGLLMLVVLVHFAPEHLAQALGHSQPAWEGVAYGVEAAVLWLVVGHAACRRTAAGLAVMAVAAYGAAEAALRPLCRLAFPMAGPPPRLAPGQTLCEVAYSPAAAWLSIGAAALVIVIVGRRAAGWGVS